MTRLKVVFAVTLVAVGAIAALSVPAGASSRARAAKACSAKGLHFRYRSGSSTQSDKVEKLKAVGATCASARSLAGTVAKDLLHGRKVPSQIGGWRPHVKNPCQGCTPVWKVSANGGGALATFEVLGGAY